MMTKSTSYCLLGLFLAVSIAAAQQRDTVNVLFIGNSYTYGNDLPGMFRGLAAAAGKRVFVDESTIGGFSLEQHFNYKPTVDKILERRWNYVVLQEQSVGPTIPFYRDNVMFPVARKLDSLIKITGSRTVFFVTWGRKTGGQFTLGSHSSILFKDYYQMQDTITAVYRRLGGELGALLCPVGPAWKMAYRANPRALLWDESDKSHAFPEGTYLAACTFYKTILGEDPIGIPYTTFDVGPEAARYYQSLGAHAAMVYGGERPRLRLWQNYPNPFSRMTTFTFTLPSSGAVSLTLFASSGRQVATIVSDTREAGTYDIYYDARMLSSGAYFCRLQFGGLTETQKVLVLR
jgi:hypothetical protein